MRRGTLAAALAAMAALGLPATSHAVQIRVMSTTDTVDAGLAADAVKGGTQGPLITRYEAANPGDSVYYIGVGTGKAIANARAGQADVVITHAPSLERQFVTNDDCGPQGATVPCTTGPGRQIFFSDYVIVGPKTGKGAGVVPEADRHDAVKAYEDIAAAGPGATATFLSRDDNSGTNVAEQNLWHLTGSSVSKTASTNPGATATQEVPVKSGWYPFPDPKTTTGGATIGQAANIQRTDQCTSFGADRVGTCFTMTDRGSFNRYLNNNPGSNLTIVADKNTPDARGGENLLVNPFSAYVVNPQVSGGTAEAVAAAQRFVDFIVSPDFQAFLPSFPNAVDPAFRPDAFPAVTVDGGLPQTATSGQQVTLAGTASSLPPGAGTVAGLPIVLQRSTDGGATWTDAGSATSGDDGRYSLATTVAQTAAYRLATPQHAATDYNDFSPGVTPIGTITVPATGGGGSTTPPAATPTPTPTPTATPAPDKTKPRVTSVRLLRRSLRLRTSEAATVKVTVQRIGTKRVRGKRRATYRTVKRVTLRAKRAGTLTRRFKAIKPGRYRLLVTATDAAGNRRSTRTTTSVKR